MNIIICDDRKDDRNNLVNLLSEYAKKKNYDFNITEYASGEQLNLFKIFNIYWYKFFLV